MKLGQLTEYNMRNIFLKKLFTKYGGDIIPRSFSKISKLRIFRINSLKFNAVCVYCNPT